MDGLDARIETRIAQRLAAPAADRVPPPGLADRIHEAIRSRRRRRRLSAGGAAAIAVAAAAVAVPVALADKPVPAPVATPRPTAPSDPLVAPHAPAELDLLIDRAGVATVRVLLPDDRFLVLLRAEALGPGGVLLGGTGFDGDPYRSSDHRVWLADQHGAAPLTGPVEAWAYAAGDRVHAWLEHRDDQHEYQLVCAEQGRPPVQVSDRGVPKKYYAPVHVDRDVVVWVDETDHAWMVRGCTDRPRQLPVDGPVVAFAYPDAYVVDSVRGVLRVVNVETMVHGAVPGVPTGVWRSELFAASTELLAWLDAGRLTVLNRRTGGLHTIASALPASAGTAGETIHLTAGHRLVAYSSRPMEGSPTTSTALVYDSRTDQEITLPSEAFASGDLLAWREGPNYVVAPVRPG